MRDIPGKNIWAQAGPLAFSLVIGSPLAAAPVADFRVERKSVDRSLSWNLGIARGQSLFGTLAYAILTKPAHGALSGAAPTLTYMPAANYTGADRFSYRVTRGKVALAPATVGITVTPKTAVGQNRLADPAASASGTVVIEDLELSGNISGPGMLTVGSGKQ